MSPERSRSTRIQIRSVILDAVDPSKTAKHAISDKLRVTVKEPGKLSRMPTSWMRVAPQQRHVLLGWMPKDYLAILPGSEIRIVTYREANQHKSRLLDRPKKFEEFVLSANELPETSNKPESIFTKTNDNTTITLTFARKELSSLETTVPLSTEDISRLDNRVPTFASDDTKLKKELQDLTISFVEDIDFGPLGMILQRLKTMSPAHPTIEIVFKALLVPYKMLDRRRGFIRDISSIAGDMCFSLKFLADVLFEPNRDSSSDETVMKLVGLIIDISRYANSNLWEGSIERNPDTQSTSSRLNEFQASLRDLSLTLREVRPHQTLVERGTSDGHHFDLLYRKLSPLELEQSSIAEDCLPGTQAKYFSECQEWVARDDISNVLWISGVPGSGKTAFVSTIARDSSRYKCAKVFVRQGTNPRTIWSSIAYQLAMLDRGIKHDLLRTSLPGTNSVIVEGASIEDQFRLLICEPLKRHFLANPLSWRIVVVIDAPDKCDRRNSEEWHRFFDTITLWRKELSHSCKLIVTTDKHDSTTPITLEGCHSLDLRAEKKDIQSFFAEKLRTACSPPPENSQINKDRFAQLADYAYGSFARASAIVDIIQPRRSEADRTQLSEVLAGVCSGATGNKGLFEELYAQILLESLRGLGFDTQGCNSLSLVLASLVLLKAELQREELLKLLAPDSVERNSDDNKLEFGSRPPPQAPSVEAALESLGYLVDYNDDEVNDENFRVFRRGFLDFLLDESRVRSLVAKFLGEEAAPKQELLIATFSISRQHALLAERCLSLLNDSNLHTVYDPEKSREGVRTASTYACDYWIYHLHGAGADYYKNSTSHKANQGSKYLENFPKLEDHIFLWLNLLGSSGSFHVELEETIERLAYTGSVPSTLTAIQDNIISHITSEVSEYRSQTNVMPLVERFVARFGRNGSGRKPQEFYEHVKALSSEVCALLLYIDAQDGSPQQTSTSAYGNSRAKIVLRESIRIAKYVVSDSDSELRRAVRHFRARSKSIRHVLDTHATTSDSPIDPPFEKQCFPGTRKSILSAVDAWIKGIGNSQPNVLWISGEPGTGKTTVASTIARNFARPVLEQYANYDCFAFFGKRTGYNHSYNLRELWADIANGLALRYQGVKESILEAMWRSSGNGYDSIDTYYPTNISIEEQFHELVYSPLKKHFGGVADPSSARRIVVIIDGLDECKVNNDDEFDAFYGAIKQWGEMMPQEYKLILTSRENATLNGKLQGKCRLIRLESGPGNFISEETNEDIGRYLITRFQEKLGTSTGWSDGVDVPGVIEWLIRHAAGSFLWATVAVDFVTRRNGTTREALLLAETLIEVQVCLRMEEEARPLGLEDRIRILYARVISMVIDETEGRNTIHLILASLVLLRNELPKRAVLELLTASEDTASLTSENAIVRALDGLAPLVVTKGENKALQVCHRSLSDFLLDQQWHRNVMGVISRGGIIMYTCRPMSDSELHTFQALFDLERQHALLAKSCLLTIVNKFSVLDDSSGSKGVDIEIDNSPCLRYACIYWVDHLEAAANHSWNLITEGLDRDINIILRRHLQTWTRALLHDDYNADVSKRLKTIAECMEKIRSVPASEVSVLARKLAKEANE
ncbi:hypothetical protein SCHPADRAFT_938701 [Schizopora paradoxa]|uniref:NACHT domain-containing protein n=1 Tax=Schizopora paradoxa TaxID=27342 RepID=A0A0H2SEK6_9AGAM|nr:hypothetical protein SCHPADRAFT_938701 [Schizopora paradoxa]